MNKSKSDTTQSRWQAFLFGPVFEFVSPLPLEECVTRLKARSERNESWFQNYRKLLARVTRLTDDSYGFRLDRNVGRNVDVQVVGSLERWEGQSTLVSGRGRLNRSFYIVTGILLIVFSAVFLFDFWGRRPSVGFPSQIMPILFPAAIIGIWLFAAVQRDQLVRIVYNTLSDEII